MAGSLKPICVSCQRFFKPERNRQPVLEQMPRDGARPGRVDGHLWSPYKLWDCDLWRCPGCGAEIVVGSGQSHFSEHFQRDLPLVLEREKRKGRLVVVNDC